MSVKLLLFFLPAVLVGIAIPLLLMTQTTVQKDTKPQATSPLKTRFSVANAPSESLRAPIISIHGDVSWQSRTASIAAPITAPQTLQQGEILSTGQSGTASLSFLNTCTISLSPDTELNLAQTLPSNIVLEVPTGQITSDKKCSNPLSIRSMHLLLRQLEGTLKVTADDTEDTITIVMVSGSAQLAFNDTDNVSTVLTILKGQTLTYDDSTRTTDIEER